MQRETTATFIVHQDCIGLRQEQVRCAVHELIARGVTDFLCGGMGGFDQMCARTVFGCRNDFPKVRSHLVIPYLSFRIDCKEYYDTILYPEGFETYHFKAAIPARNRYMVDHAAYALCFVEHSWGGAAKTYSYALKKKLTIINLGIRADG